MSRSSVGGPALLPMEQHTGKPPIRLTRPVYVVGSRSSARIHLVSSSVSKAHALIVRNNGRTYIRDLASRTKVFVNGKEIREADLEDGDLVKIGSFTFRYISGPNEESPRSNPAVIPAKLDIVGADYPVPIDQRVMLIGRRSACDVTLVEESVSIAHSVIFEMDGRRYIRDLGSRTGTFVNGVNTHQHQLTPGDTIHIGETDLRYLPNEVAGVTVVDEHEVAAASIPSLLETDEAHETHEAPQAYQPPEIHEEEPEIAPEPIEVESVEAELPAEEPSVDPRISVGGVEIIEPRRIIPAIAEAIPVEPEPLEEKTIEPEELAPETLEPEPLAEEQLEKTEESDLEPPQLDVIEEAAAEAEAAIETEELAETDVEEPVSEESPISIEAAIPLEPEIPAEPEIPVEAVAEVEPEIPIQSGTQVEAEMLVDDLPAEPTSAVEAAIPIDEEPLALAKEEPVQAPAALPAAEKLGAPATKNQDNLDVSDLLALNVPEAEVEEVSVPEAPSEPLINETEPPVAKATEAFVPEVLAINPDVESQNLMGLMDSLAGDEPTDLLDLKGEAAALEVEADVDGDKVLSDLDLEQPSEDLPPLPAVEELELPAPEAEEVATEPEPHFDLTAELDSEESFAAQSAGLTFDDSPRPLIAADAIPEGPPPGLEIDQAPQPAADARVEIIESTEPTTESALLSAADQLALDALGSPDAAIPSPAEELTDTSFGRAVQEFTGDESGEIVEPPPVQSSSPVEPSVAQPISESPAPLVKEVLPIPAIPAMELPPIELDTPVAKSPSIRPEPAIAAAEIKSEPVAKAESGRSVVSEAPPAVPPQVAKVPDAPKPEAQKTDTPRIPWGANQENFLGGVPLALVEPPKRPVKGTPVGEKAVKDLIAEIDSAAAAAEAATAKPKPAPARPEPEPPLIAKLPPRPKRGGAAVPPRRKREQTISVSEGGLTPEPPSASAPVSTGFDGLAITPSNETDVFSQMPPAVPPDEALKDRPARNASSTGSVPPLRPEPTSASRRPRSPLSTPPGGMTASQERTEESEGRSSRRPAVPPIPATVEGSLAGGGHPPVAYAAEITDLDVAEVRRKYIRRATLIVVSMVLFIAASSWGIYNYVGVPSTIEGSVTFKNLAAQNKREQTLFQEQQVRLLKEDITRRRARGLLRPEFVPKFLDDQVEYFKIADRAGFDESQPDRLIIRMNGTDADGDAARITAMGLALYDANASLTEDAIRQRRSVEDLNRQIEKSQKDLDSITAEIDKLRLADESRPTNDQIEKIKTQVTELEKAWNETVRAMKSAEAELERAKAVPGADGAPAVAAAEDEKIKAMQTELDQLQAKVNATRSATSEQASEARKQLDSALEAFEKQIAEAQSMMNGNPEVAAYVQAAQKLQETTRQVTDDLISSQEQQFGRLNELKERLNEKLEQRRVEIWTKDKQLQDLGDRLAYQTRQYNAAVGGGLQKEVDDLKVEMNLTKNMIKARQELLPGDSFYTDTVRELQVIVDATKKSIADDRRKTELLLTTLQQGFTSNPSVQRLPAEQKQLAEQLQKQLASINSARKQYNLAVDEGAADADTQLKTQISTLQAAIESQKKQAAQANLKGMMERQEEARLAAINSKQVELEKLTETETTARAAYFDKYRELRDTQARLTDAKKNDEALDALIRRKDVQERGHHELVAQLDSKQRQVKAVIEPIKPAAADIVITRGQDRRLLYTMISGGAILVLFFGLLLHTLHAAAIEVPTLANQAAQNASLPDPSELDSDEDRKKPHDPDEDHQPAII